MHPAVAQLNSLMPPPPLPPLVAPPWGEIERAIGFGLPSDYRDFIDCYGEGQVNQELSVFFPAERAEGQWSLTSLLDRSRRLRSFGLFDLFEADDRRGPADFLMWGKTSSGDLLFWLRDGDDPDRWPTYMLQHVHHLDPSRRWRRFDGGITEFLIALVDGSFPEAATLIGDHPRVARWSRLRDWRNDYGSPPSAVFDDIVTDGVWHADGRAVVPGGSPIRLRNFNRSGGDQARFPLTGELVPLITLDSAQTTIHLDGGSRAPGIIYSFSGRIDFAPGTAPGSVRVELLRDGDPIAAATVEHADSPRAHIAAETLVPADAPAASVRLHIAAATPVDIIVTDVYLHAKGTLDVERSPGTLSASC
ncbi:hypothetical protein ACFXPS_42715 [Nocardia sp. NPDC059091]|uniref:hypothetical protein n=1 Tax=unclassified Nocardia TaxID=2637762 RepID=UPI003683CFB5